MIILVLLAIWPANSEARTQQGAFAEEDSPAQLRAKVLPRLPIPEAAVPVPRGGAGTLLPLAAPGGAGQD